MALILKDRVKETSLTSGSGTITLDGAVAGYQSFSGIMSSGDTTYYTIVNGDKWEVGVGTYSTNSLSRDTLLSSSTGSKISLSGQSYVFVAYPAEKSVYRNTNDQIVVTDSGIRFNDGTIQTTSGGSSYTAGNGLQLSGSEFSVDNTVVQSGDNISVLANNVGYLTSHPSIASASSSNNSGRTYIQDILLDSNGHVTGITTSVESVVDTDTTYTAGTGLQLIGTTFSVDSSVARSGSDISIFTNNAGYLTSHPSISATSSSNNSGRVYVQDILLDSNGHVTGIATATETVTDTTYSAGTGLQLSGTTFSIDSSVVISGQNVSVLSNDVGYLTSHPVISAASSSNNSGRTYIQDILLDGNGHITGIVTAIETVVDTDTTYTAGTGLQISGTTFSVDSTVARSGNDITIFSNNAGYLTAHPTVSGASSSDNSGRTYVQDILLDSNGHVTGIQTATETVVDTDTTYSEGDGINLSGTVFSVDTTVARSGGSISIFSNDSGYLTSHPAISAASSSNNSGRTYIQDILIDSNGHITGITTAAETVVDTDTTYSAGSGLKLSSTVFDTYGTGNFNSIVLNEGIPLSTSSQIYNSGGVLCFNGSGIGGGGGTSYSAGSGLNLSGSSFSTSGTGVFSSILMDSGIPASVTNQFYNSGGMPCFNGSGLISGFKPVRPWFKDSTIAYGPPGGGASTYSQNHQILIAYPMSVPDCTINTIRIVVKTAGTFGSKIRLGIATPHTDNRPGLLLSDFGTVAGDSTGQKSISLGTPLNLSCGWYYVLCQKDGGSGAVGISSAGWAFSDGMMGNYYIAATPEVHPITWWYLQNSTGAFLSSYASSGWLPQVSTATPRVMFHP